jgi:hypothetical protein
MAFTVVPLHNLRLPAGTRIPFGDNFTLQATPEWVKADKGTLANINYQDRQSTLAANYALVAEYEADSMGEPDPRWAGTIPKSIQDLRFQSAMLANLAMWLRQPSTVCFTVCFHALSRLNGRPLDSPVILNVDTHTTLYCHPSDLRNPFEIHHAQRAGELHTLLSTVPRGNSVWTALRAVWAALTSYQPDYRYPLFWQGLESLFGSHDKTWKVTVRLCNRLSYFLADAAPVQQELYAKVNDCYDARSKIIHGSLVEGDAFDRLMLDTERIARTAMRHILEKPRMLEIFVSNKRDDFLERWVQSGRFVPPPFPE